MRIRERVASTLGNVLHPLTARLLPGWVDPAALFATVEQRSNEVFWLDAGDSPVEGWSFVGEGVRADAGPGGVVVDSASRGGTESPSREELPPFRGGWVGWLDYESGAAAAGAPVAHSELSEAQGGDWMRVTRAVAFDHRRRRVWALAAEPELEAWSETVGTSNFSGAKVPQALISAQTGSAATRWERTAVARDTPVAYAALIERCRQIIRAGLAYQLCLTTRFTVPGEHDAVDAYLRLRTATPAHHGGFVRIGARALLSASPEQFLHASGGVLRTRPIKGTRPRGSDPVEDAALAAELAASAKERAENVMIVDLMRNDLSRVSEPGTIRVEGLWEVESYPAVHQLVSTVSGRAVAGLTVDELLRATFPAGSMTGAPKLSAMTQLHALEEGPRGVFAGCFGYVGVDGTLDLAMVIRSILIDADEATVGAGGGITWGSVPADEVAEVATKARAPLAALGAVLPADWRSDILT